jgi:thioredoxin reductase (NADPH)
MESERPGVFIAGVIAAGSNKTFIENGRLHGPVIARALADRSARVGRVRSAS